MSARSPSPPSATPPVDTSAPAERVGLSVDELSTLTGVSVRNIRAYQTAGLLPSPTLQGRQALYGAVHRQRLEIIKELRSLGFGLEAIGDMLGSDASGPQSSYALIAQMFSRGFFQVERPVLKTVDEMTNHWGENATPEQLDQLIRNGLYRRVSPEGTPANQAVVEVLSPSLWTIGKEMAELKVPMGTVLTMQERLIEHCRSLARIYVDQFVVSMVREMQLNQGHAAPEGLSPSLLRAVHQLIERLRPIAIGSISAAFPVVLQQEFDKDVLSRIQALAADLLTQADAHAENPEGSTPASHGPSTSSPEPL